MKSRFFFYLIFCLLVSGLAAQEAEEAGKDSGFTVTIDLKADLLGVNAKHFGSSEIRGPEAQNNTVWSFLINNRDFWTDSEAALEYEGERFGGKYALKAGDIVNAALFGKISGWVRLGAFRFLLGNDIESTYADSLGADPALRIYTGSSGSKPAWNASVNPDNITQSTGLLAEANFKPFYFALAAGDFLSKFMPTRRLEGTSNNNEYKTRYDVNFRYGARLGYELGAAGRLNVSYIIEEKTVAESYDIKGGSSTELVPTSADAQVFDHLFGLYGSFHLPSRVDLTLGLNGIATSYLSEYYISAGTGEKQAVSSGYPLVFKAGLNLNARWQPSPALTLRTDHNLTMWDDKDYLFFETGNNQWKNANLETADNAEKYEPVNHLVLWNGIGADYRITETLSGGVYARNLISRYNASGQTPTGTGDYTLLRDQLSVELKLVHQIGPNALAYFKLIAEEFITSRSLDLNAQDRSARFVDKVHGAAPEPVATLDTDFSVRIPIGIVLKFR